MGIKHATYDHAVKCSEGQVLDKHDQRTIPNLDLDFWKDARLDKEGQAWVPVDTVNRLLDEYEYLKTELFTHDSYEVNHVNRQLGICCGYSVRDIKNKISNIETHTKGQITGQMVFSQCYALLSKSLGVDFSQCPSHIPKLTWLWQIGALPLVSMYVDCFYMMVYNFSRQNITEFRLFCDKIKQKPTLKKGGADPPF